MSPGGRPATTTADDWAQAALDEIEHAGVRALTVEAVARRLGVSKGGAYHHFADRRQLLRAALSRWETRQVTELNARFEEVSDPRERLHRVLVEAFVDLEPTIIVQLLAAADEPEVTQVLERSTEARLALFRRMFVQLGATRAVAGHQALIAYGHYLGFAQLRRHAPHLVSTPARVRKHLQRLERSLLTDLDIDSSSAAR